jgi:hypothetical protein
MTHLMAPGGPPRATEGRFPLTARGVALRSWCAAPRREPRLTSGQGKPVKWAFISELWYYGGHRARSFSRAGITQDS